MLEHFPTRLFLQIKRPKSELPLSQISAFKGNVGRKIGRNEFTSFKICLNGFTYLFVNLSLSVSIQNHTDVFMLTSGRK